MSKVTPVSLTARSAARKILLKAGQSPIQALLDTKLLGENFNRQEAGLTTELVYGYLRLNLRLNWLLDLFLKSPGKTPPKLRLILGLALYELLHLDKVPAHATVHEAVTATSQEFSPGLAKVANGVLRSILRLQAQEDLLSLQFYAQRIPDPNLCLSIYYSLPLWILQLWQQAYSSAQVLALAKASLSTPHPCIRLNALRPEWEKLQEIMAEYGSKIAYSGIQFPPGSHPDYLRDYLRQGKLSWQNAGSQELLFQLQAHTWPAPLWDATAGHGTKTFALLEQNINITLASDTHLPRLLGLQQEAKRLAIPCPPLICTSAAKPAHAQQFKTILLDVPCSGLGTLARHPDIKLRLQPADLAALVQTQAEILHQAWQHLEPNGLLVYTTCTQNLAENNLQVAKFIATHQASLQQEYNSPINTTGSDIMYGAVLRKQ